MSVDSLQGLLAEPTVRGAALAVLGIATIFLVRRMARNALAARVAGGAARYRIRKLTDFLTYLGIALFLSVLFSDRLGGLTVAFGVAGAGVAFALQEVIASVAGWIAITFADFYKVGDRVMLGGIRGDVIDIGVLRTTLFEIGAWLDGDAYNGRVVRLANSFVFKEPVFNYTADFPFLWDEITVPVRHGSDRELARQTLAELAEKVVGDYTREISSTWQKMTRKYVIEDAQVEPLVTMTMDESWMTFRLRYVVAWDKRRITKDTLFEGVMTAFDASNGHLSLPSSAQEITLMRPSSVIMEKPPVRQ